MMILHALESCSAVDAALPRLVPWGGLGAYAFLDPSTNRVSLSYGRHASTATPTFLQPGKKCRPVASLTSQCLAASMTTSCIDAGASADFQQPCH